MTDAATFHQLYGMTRSEHFEDPEIDMNQEDRGQILDVLKVQAEINRENAQKAEPLADLQSRLATLRRIHADVISDNITLRNEIKRLRSALVPFAAEFDEWENKHSQDFYITDEPTQDCNRAQFTMRDLRTAANLVNGE